MSFQMRMEMPYIILVVPVRRALERMHPEGHVESCRIGTSGMLRTVSRPSTSHRLVTMLVVELTIEKKDTIEDGPPRDHPPRDHYYLLTFPRDRSADLLGLPSDMPSTSVSLLGAK